MFLKLVEILVLEAKLFADERVAVLRRVAGTSDDGRGGVEAAGGEISLNFY